MTACSSSTTPSLTSDAATSMTTYTPAIGGDAETGVKAISQDTGFDPAQPADPTSALGAQLQQAQSLLLPDGGPAGATAASATPTTGTGTGVTAAAMVTASGGFQRALAERISIQLDPMRDGASAIANLDRIVEAREQRVRRIEEAFLSDPSASQADQQLLDQERLLLEETRGLRDKLATLAPTIDANEAGAILQLVGSANQRGSYHPEQLAELMIQIEGSAHNLPSSYLEAAMQAQELLEQTRDDMDAMLQQIAQAGDTTKMSQALAQILEMQENQLATQEALRANFELAKRDPAAAEAQLRQVAAA